MQPPIDAGTPTWVLVAVFIFAASAVWVSGARLTRIVDGLALRTGMGHAFAGMLLLAGITSLPETATVGVAAGSGSPNLALANLLGSSAINVLLLAALDPLIGRGAMTGFIARPSTMLQGVLSTMILVTAAAAMIIGDVPVLGVGVWTIVLAALALGAFRLSSSYEGRTPWIPAEPRDGHDGREEGLFSDDRSTRTLWLSVVGLGAVIFAAGALLSWSGDAIAVQSGLGQSFVGFLLVGFSTSLPEVTTIVVAYRLGRYEMAVGDIFGTNIFNTGLLLLADAAHRGEPVLNLAGPFEAVAALLGALMTCVFLLGLLERRDRTILRMGYDSAAVIVLFLAGAVLLYPLSQQ
ncbi:MAG TPA: sodium:calcium antiporter [Brevundimonas sp.]|nr:sodium:calcium antiporter [Brevundimonas sp.]